MMFTIFSDVLMFENIFLSPQVKRSLIVSNINWYIGVASQLGNLEGGASLTLKGVPLYKVVGGIGACYPVKELLSKMLEGFNLKIQE